MSVDQSLYRMRSSKMAKAGMVGMVLLSLASLASAQKQNASISPVELQTKSGGHVWIYLPEASSTNERLPCVLVPPAGSPLFVGMRLSQDDRVEQLPYAKAGFVVVSFDISGPSSETRNTPQLR